MSFFEIYLGITISVRTFTFFYSMLFFLLFVIILNPFSKSGNILWNIRIEIFFLIFWFWFLSGYINSIDVLLTDIWDTFNINKGAYHGPSFYELFYKNYLTISDKNMESMTNTFLNIWHDNTILIIKDTWRSLLSQSDTFKYVIKIIKKIIKLLVKQADFFYKKYYFKSIFHKEYLNFINFCKTKFYVDYVYITAPFYFSIRCLLDFFKGDPFFFSHFFEKIINTRNLSYRGYYYGLSGFDLFTFYKQSIKNVYFDMWGNYKPKADFYFTFYGRQERFFTTYEMDYLDELNVNGRDIIARTKIKNKNDLTTVDINNNKIPFFSDEEELFYISKAKKELLLNKENPEFKRKVIFDRELKYETIIIEKNIRQFKQSNFHYIRNLWPYEFRETVLRDYSGFFSSVYIPDLAFMGSPTWFYDINLLQLDHSIKSDAIMGDRYEDDQMN